MNFKNTIIFIVTLSTAIKATENFDDYTVFSGTAGIRMSQSEDMAECKQRCTRGAQQDALYNFCLLYTSPSPRDAESSRMPSSA